MLQNLGNFESGGGVDSLPRIFPDLSVRILPIIGLSVYFFTPIRALRRTLSLPLSLLVTY